MKALATIILLSSPAIYAATPPAGKTASCDKEASEAARSVMTTFRRLADEYADALPGPDGSVYRERKVDTLLAYSIDLETFSERALRRAWKRADQATRQRWRQALGAMLHRKYRQRLGRPDQVIARIVKSTSNCVNSTVTLSLVRMRPTSAGRSAAETVLQLRFANGRWRVYDVRIGEVSLLATWRSRFRRIFQQGGLKAVDRELRNIAKRYPCKTNECRLFQTP